MVATMLRNFASYAAALAGFTAAIIASNTLGATGGASGIVFDLAVTRATEILIGIICASAVLAVTTPAGARQALANRLNDLSTRVVAGLLGVLRSMDTSPTERQYRHILLGQVSALCVVIDQATGEISALPFRAGVLHHAMDGLAAAGVHHRTGWHRQDDSSDCHSGPLRRKNRRRVSLRRSVAHER
jgi:hypothetical protein